MAPHPGVAEAHERAMGSSVHVIVHADAGLADVLVSLALRRIALLEQCWSRFRADSELNHLNALAGSGPVKISPDLAVLVRAMVDASAATQGRYDPTVHGTMLALGYDADFATVISRAALASVSAVLPPGVTGIVIDDDAQTVSLPAGCTLDPGAIGKGLAADIVAGEIHTTGAHGVLVNIGGDLAVRGHAGSDLWTIGVRDDRREDSPTTHTLVLSDDARAVATTSSLRRRWGAHHHVIDPRTGQPAVSDLAQVSVVAPTGALAEAAATAALVLGAEAGAEWLRAQQLDALLFPHDPDSPPTRILEPSHA
jgi:thiamine biosynthesis lipoprotein